MSYYALKDSDWAFDDQDEGRAIVVQADTPEEAISKATAMHIKEIPGAGGVTWEVARLDLVGIGDAEWDDDNQPKFEAFRFYEEGLNAPSETCKRIKALEAKLATANALVTCCCGDLVDAHNMGSGHSPVDQYHYAMMQLETKLATAEKALEPFADIADLIDAETEGMAETDELVLHFHDYEFAKWPVSFFREARAVLGGKPS
ncbi:hypothetical protein [Ochrobactrum sp. 3-3]|uniref:hypothetical protein n=1 Tax=Ochrobactrum sp. 3-3 TaxID=1830124 RepID=UPI000DF00B6E|nr:hypothetical protein [Ochrobactrum sp. 3-3]